MTIKFLNIKRWAAILPLIFVASVALAQQNETKYKADGSKYMGNSSIVIAVNLNGEPIDCEVAAFNVEDDECRGAGYAQSSDKYGPRIVLVLQCDTEFTMYFRVVFNIDGIEYDVRAKNKYSLASGAMIGSKKNPYVIDITSIDIKPTQGYQTYFDSNQSYLLPPGLNGYTYSIDGSALTCNKSYDSESSFKPSGLEVKGAVLPKETAAVLYTKSEAETITIVATEDKGYAPAAKSSLYGTDVDTEITAAEGEKHYILGVGSKGLGFYIAYDPKAEKRSFTNKAHKAYLYLDAQQAKMAPAMISLGSDEDGEADGIAAVLCDDTPAASSQPVNLLGIPVSDDYQGVVIINGKKVLKR